VRHNVGVELEASRATILGHPRAIEIHHHFAIQRSEVGGIQTEQGAIQLLSANASLRVASHVRAGPTS
jgi:hypothetical protein